MTVTFPRTDIMDFVDWSQATVPLTLMSRQEQSRLASGRTIGKDFGSALWFGDFTSVPLPAPLALQFEAMMASLDGVIGTFECGDMREDAQYPAAHSNGGFMDTGILVGVGADNKTLAISGLMAGFKLTVGDYLAFDYAGNRALHRVMETNSANNVGTTAYFEVRPHIRAGWVAGAPVTLKRPRGIFNLVPSSLKLAMNASDSSTVSFQAIQAFSS